MTVVERVPGAAGARPTAGSSSSSSASRSSWSSSTRRSSTSRCPRSRRDLGFSATDLQWVVNGYTLAVRRLPAARRAGRRPDRPQAVFLAGVVLFTIASLLCGLARSSEMLIAARALQGLGAALVSPAALSIITTTFAEGPERTKALGVWAAIAAGGGAFGLLLGGILVEALSWEWIFFVNVPVGIAAFLFSLRHVPESKAPGEHDSLRHRGRRLGHRGPDRARVRDRQGASRSAGARPARSASSPPRSSCWARSWPSSCARRSRCPPRHLPDPLAAGREHRVAGGRRGHVRDLLLHDALRAGVLGYSPLEAGLAFLPVTVGISPAPASRSSSSSASTCADIAVFGMVLAACGPVRPQPRAGRRHLPRQPAPRPDARCRSAWA